MALPQPLTNDDAVIFREVVRRDCYGLRKISADTVFHVLDVGAHTGIFSAYAARLFKHAHILAVEMNPENAQQLAMRVQGLPVEILEAAVVGSRVVRGACTIDSRSYGHGLVYADQAQYFGEPSNLPDRTIQARELLQRQHFDLVKIDAEGAEYDLVLDGDLTSVRYLLMEIHLWALPARGWETMQARLRAQGFDVTAALPSAVGQFLVRAVREQALAARGGPR